MAGPAGPSRSPRRPKEPRDEDIEMGIGGRAGREPGAPGPRAGPRAVRERVDRPRGRGGLPAGREDPDQGEGDGRRAPHGVRDRRPRLRARPLPLRGRLRLDRGRAVHAPAPGRVERRAGGPGAGRRGLRRGGRLERPLQGPALVPEALRFQGRRDGLLREAERPERGGGRDGRGPDRRRPVRGHGADSPARARPSGRRGFVRHRLRHLLRPPRGPLPALPLQRLPSAEHVGVVGRLRPLLRPLQRVRFPHQLGMGLGPLVLVRQRALLRVRLPAGLPTALPRRPLRPTFLLVVGRLGPVAEPVARLADALQVASSSRLRAAEQVRRRAQVEGPEVPASGLPGGGAPLRAPRGDGARPEPGRPTPGHPPMEMGRERAGPARQNPRSAPGRAGDEGAALHRASDIEGRRPGFQPAGSRPGTARRAAKERAAASSPGRATLRSAAGPGSAPVPVAGRSSRA